MAARLLFAAVLEVALLNPAPLRLWERALAPVGLCSYTVYLFHLTLIGPGTQYLLRQGVELNFLGSWLSAGGAILALTLTLSWVCYRGLELGSVRFGEFLWLRFTSRKGNAVPGLTVRVPAIP